MGSSSIVIDSVSGPCAPSASAFSLFIDSSLLDSLRELFNGVFNLLPFIVGERLIGVIIEDAVGKLQGAGEPLDGGRVGNARLGKEPGWRLVKSIEIGLRGKGPLVSSGESADVSELPKAPAEGGGFGLGRDFDGGAEGFLKDSHTGRGHVPRWPKKMVDLASLGSILFHRAGP